MAMAASIRTVDAAAVPRARATRAPRSAASRLRAAPRRAATVAADVPATVPPAGVYAAAANVAAVKASYPLAKTLALGLSAGMLIGLGAGLMSHVGGTSPALAAANPGACDILKGLIGLPCGLTLVVLTGAELFTGNVFVMLSGLMEGTVEVRDLVKSWITSWTANFAGAALMAWMCFHAKTMAAGPFLAVAKGMAVAKCSIPLFSVFMKGVLCNYLVCLGVWGAMSSTDVGGKILAILLPVSAFVAMGFEHSVANMFLLPQGMLHGAPITFADMMLKNIIPVTLGNIVGAGLFVAGIHAIAYNTYN